MRLDLFLVDKNFCESRQEAQECIRASSVSVDGVVSSKPSKEVSNDASVELSKRRAYVSRGGEKLEGAFYTFFGGKEHVETFLNGKKALDVGSSTGGFTDFLLKHGVHKVSAIDVGTSQLHARLRSDTRVELHENTDIREYTALDPFDVIVADLSFIPLHMVLEKVLSCGHDGSLCSILVKPQFEVGKGNTKKGVVKDDALVEEVLEKYKMILIKKAVKDLSVLPCVIQGGDGNQEYFLCFRLSYIKTN